MGDFNIEIIRNKKVALIGVGALGTVIANQLVRIGVGEIRLIDRDFVEESNLQRQMLFDEQDAKERLPKAIAAVQKLEQINSKVTLTPFITDVHAGTIESLVQGVDIILDGTDNMETRFLINDVSVKYNIPWVYGGAIHSRGVSTTIIPMKTPCFRCLFHQVQSQHGQTCDTVGVLGPVVHIIASLQVAEALKLLKNDFSLIRKDMIQVDIWNHDIDFLPIENNINPNCPCCQQKIFEYLHRQVEDNLLSQLCGRDSIQITPSSKRKVNLAIWEEKWSSLGHTERNPFLLRLHYQSYRLTLFTDGRLLIQGTDDPKIARRIYAQLMGH